RDSSWPSTAGMISAVTRPMITTTTISSISVNPRVLAGGRACMASAAVQARDQQRAAIRRGLSGHRCAKNCRIVVGSRRCRDIVTFALSSPKSAILSLMRRTIPLALLLCACTPSTPEPGDPSTPVPAPPTKTKSKTDPEPAPANGCAEQIARYLADRQQLSRCETDSDCAEMWPGLCPHGPYYIDREADIEGVLALEREIIANCEIPECEPPIELGIGH